MQAHKKKKSTKIMKIKMFITLNKAKPDVENIRDLNLGHTIDPCYAA
jgi:hypothetical protein